MSKIDDILVYGEASGKIIDSFALSELPSEKNLMNALRERGLPIASSCGGEGVCQKCQLFIGRENKTHFFLSCQWKRKDLENFLRKGHNTNSRRQATIRISYL